MSISINKINRDLDYFKTSCHFSEEYESLYESFQKVISDLKIYDAENKGKLQNLVEDLSPNGEDIKNSETLLKKIDVMKIKIQEFVKREFPEGTRSKKHLLTLASVLDESEKIFLEKEKMQQSLREWKENAIQEGTSENTIEEVNDLFLIFANSYDKYIRINSFDDLKSLPDVFNYSFFIERLQTLDVKNNALKELPPSLSYCKNLQTANFSSNPEITGIPNEIMFAELPNTLIDLTGSGLSERVRQSLRETIEQDGYNGPRIAYSMPEPINESIPDIRESLEWLCANAEIEFQDFSLIAKTPEEKNILKGWLANLSRIADCGDKNLKKKFSASILKYLKLASEKESYRSVFFMIIEGANITCGDRMALSVLHLELAAQLEMIDINDLKALKEFLVKGPWTIDLLEGIARDKISTLRFFDEIETYLAYPILLREKLEIPISLEKMLFQSCSSVSPNDLEAAYLAVMQKREEETEQYLIKHEKWIEALSKKFPEEYQAIMNNRDRLTEEAETNEDYVEIERTTNAELIRLTKKAL